MESPTVPQTGPRITKEHVDAILAATVYTDTKMGIKSTVVCAQLPNGFEIRESSGCVDPGNYDHALGVAICKRRLADQVWMLEGYRLQCELHQRVERIARAAHELNRAYCQSISDDSQPTWDDAPEWQRASAIAGVRFHLANPDATPAASHEAWLAVKRAEGWTYGPVKDPAAKTHPCFRPYEELPQEQRSKDFIFRAAVHALKG